MTVPMHHPETGGRFLAPASAVELHQASGWELDDPNAVYDRLPPDVQPFEGQATVRMVHDGIDEVITVAESAAPIHAATGWRRVEDVREETLEDQTVEQLRETARDLGLKVSGSKADLVDRIRAEQEAEDSEPVEPAGQEEDG